MKSLKIEKGIPLPPKRGGRYPLMDMAPGDSFLLPCSPSDRERYQGRLVQRGKDFGRKHGVRFATRQVEGGIRCWRVA